MAEAGSSFIPKQSNTPAPTSRRRRRFSLLNFIATVLLIGSLLLAGGTYIYKGVVDKNLEEDKLALENERGRFSETDIASVESFNRKLLAARYLLDNHLIPSRVFDALELDTKESVQFTSFTYERRPSDEVTVVLRGITEAFGSVSLQDTSFSNSPVLRDSLFTDLSSNIGLAILEEEEIKEGEDEKPLGVGFSVIGTIPRSTLRYEKIELNDAIPAPQPDTSTPQPSEEGQQSPDEEVSVDATIEPLEEEVIN